MSSDDAFEVLVEPGLYELRSLASASIYLVDTRLGLPPRYLRVAGALSRQMRLDLAWRPLAMIESLPRHWDGARDLRPNEIDHMDVRRWTIRIGSAHRFYTREPEPARPPVYWVQSSTCDQIRVLDAIASDVLEQLGSATREGTP